VTDILDELTWRGLIAQSTDPGELRKVLGAGPVTLYGGFDPTAPGLHIGNLVLLLTMRRFQLAGHRPIALVGGATGLIGDPSGKSAERVLNPREVVADWVGRIRGEVSRFLDFGGGPSGALAVSNLDWTAPLSALEFLRDIGKHFPVSQMLSRESVRARLEAGGISYTEFSYQILQANDFLELYRRHECTLQLGGSDQWGNLVAGVDLIRRVDGAAVHALATPLITRPDGTKYGKTEGGAIWLSPGLMSPYAFYQFWLNRGDEEVPGLLRVFTFRSRDEIEALEAQIREAPAARMAQRVLAAEVTELVHGAAETEKAIAASHALFGQGELAGLDEKTLAAALAEVPSATVRAAAGPAAEARITAAEALRRAPDDEHGAGPDGPGGGPPAGGHQVPAGHLPTVAELMTATGIVPSKSAARRAINEGGAYLNNRKVTSEDQRPSQEDLLHGRFLVLRRGKRTVGGVRIDRG
jgi:tyrosyl-tRNA synthetase